MTSLAWNPPRIGAAWRLPMAATVGLVLLVLLSYRETAVAMVEIWDRSATFTHAFVVPPIVAWLIWRKRSALAQLQPRPLPWMLPVMASLAGLWWLGHLVNVASAMQFAMTAMVVATVPLVLGAQVTRVLAFPLVFAFFAVPIGEFLTPTLMHWTVEALVAGLRLTGIPVYQEGQQLVIPSGRWAVVSACSGIRYLMASFMVGSLFAYLNYRSTLRRLVFVAVSIVLPVVANWVRAYMIVMLGHLSNNEIATGADHLIYGWVFFGVVILGLFFIGARWSEFEPPEGQGNAAARRVREGVVAETARWRTAVVALLALLVVQWPMWVEQRVGQPAGTSAARLDMPESLGAWRGEAAAPDAWRPYFPTASLRQARSYRGPPGAVTVHIAYFRGQTGDVKLVSSENGWIDAVENHWNLLSQGRTKVDAPGGAVSWRTAKILAVEAAGRSDAVRPRLTVWQLYWIGGRLAQGDIEAKLVQAWLAVRGEPDDAAAVHLVSAQADDAAADRELATFVRENIDLIQASLMRARQSR